MKSTKTSVLLAAAMLVLTTPLFAATAAKIDPAAAKNALKAKLGSISKKVVIDNDASLTACKAFQDLKAKANADYASCLGETTAPAGSPLHEFNNASNFGLGDICGSKPLDQCVADVIKAQEAFCKAKVKPTEDAAAAAKKQCIEAARECSKAQLLVKAIENSIVTLEAKKKQIEADLKKATDDLTAKNTDLTAAKAKATAECKR